MRASRVNSLMTMTVFIICLIKKHQILETYDPLPWLIWTPLNNQEKWCIVVIHHFSLINKKYYRK